MQACYTVTLWKLTFVSRKYLPISIFSGGQNEQLVENIIEQILPNMKWNELTLEVREFLVPLAMKFFNCINEHHQDANDFDDCMNLCYDSKHFEHAKAQCSKN